MPLTLYHRTTRQAAAAILRTGFRDGAGAYGTDQEYTGVWVSAGSALSPCEGAHGSVVLVVAGLSEAEFEGFEWVEPEKPYREALIPARLLNERGRIEEVWLDESADDAALTPEQALSRLEA